ncbi:unnamed protein product [Ambrosiozyma monospora]|uniref:Unnamed protein product n=1 Tax=Ambrosiozyma monospora TaxID=43982 RepID=A0ACB5UAG7_AMBMO|nr:unnamed protein product [Ambrosiozyma monospora]
MCIPSVLCHEAGIFSLLDILKLLFQSVIDGDTNEYEPQIVFTSDISGVKLVLSDSHKWRVETLNKFSSHAKSWVTQCQLKSRLNMKSILRSYVTKSHTAPDEVNFGSSFALEMAGKVLPSDKELYTLEPSTAGRISLTSGLLTQHQFKREPSSIVAKKLIGLAQDEVPPIALLNQTKLLKS